MFLERTSPRSKTSGSLKCTRVCFYIDYPPKLVINTIRVQWASCQIRKLTGCACAGNAGNVFPVTDFKGKPLVSDPDMHHGTCVTDVQWCISGSLTLGGGGKRSWHCRRMRNLQYTYLVRGQYRLLITNFSLAQSFWGDNDAVVLCRISKWFGNTNWCSGWTRFCEVWVLTSIPEGYPILQKSYEMHLLLPVISLKGHKNKTSWFICLSTVQ